MLPIINSILDTDLYKLTQQWGVVNKFPNAKIVYDFINRNDTEFPEGFDDKLREQLKFMEEITLSQKEKEFLEDKCYYLPRAYVDFLSGYLFDSNEVTITQENGNLEITIEGYWYRTILWEVPLMAIISELYYRLLPPKIICNRRKREDNNHKKARTLTNGGIKYADFGTRRRFNYENHSELIYDFWYYENYIKKEIHRKNFIGTSNVHFAHSYNLTPIGTHAHEWFMFHGAYYGYNIANQKALENWSDVYNGNLGIALSDTYTSNDFFKNFNTKLAKLYDGVRHDSGDPIEFMEKTIKHYEKLNINPRTKTIIFSDGLNPYKALEIQTRARNRINVSFGIGTNFTNDVGVEPLNIVVKMTGAEINNKWINTIKLSDEEEKYTGDEKEIKLAKQILRI